MKINNEKLRFMIAEKGYSVRAFAKVAGVSASMLNLTLNHGNRPRLDIVGKIANALGVSIMDLVEDEQIKD